MYLYILMFYASFATYLLFVFPTIDNPYVFIVISSFWLLDQFFFLVATFKNPGFAEKEETGSLLQMGLLRTDSIANSNDS
jgi:hypothetical protein